jgi:hypothetical protein
LIALRNELPALREGEHRSLFGLAPDVLAWRRSLGSEQLLVIANMAGDPRTVDVSRLGAEASVVASTGSGDRTVRLHELDVGPLEGLILRL